MSNKLFISMFQNFMSWKKKEMDFHTMKFKLSFFGLKGLTRA
jgi:hypothetical protein